MATSPSNVLPFRSARPTLEVDGERRQVLESALLLMELGDVEDGMARAELTFGNWGGPEGAGFQHFDRRILDFGKPLKVRLGDDLLFEGRISAILADYPDADTPTITILAEDRLQDLRMTRRSRSFADRSVADIVRQIAGDHGLTADVSLSGFASKLTPQLNQSDFAFLQDLARREDAQIWVEGSKLRAAKTRPTDKVELRYSGSLREFHVEADLAHQRSALVAGGWDVAAKSAASHRATESAISAELGSLQSGGSILASAFASRTDTVAHAVPRDAQEAKAIAEAGYRQLARRFVCGHGTGETSAKLRVGATLALSGLGPLFDGDYRATAVRHLFDSREGQRSEFACQRPGLGRP